MNTKYKVLLVGCGSGGAGSAGSHSIGYAHAQCYQAHPKAEIVAACDLNAENLTRFQQEFNVPEGDTDLAKLLERVQPDIISICTFVSAHKPIFDVVKHAKPKAIMMEKPFALCADDARAMTRDANALGIKMCINHFRRLRPVYARAREILDSGDIGDVQMITTAVAEWDQMEWGTHWLDMIRFYKHDQEIDWVFGQVECSGRDAVKQIANRTVNYGHIVEDHSMNYFCFKDGTRALLDAGKALPGEAIFSFLGTKGALYLNGDGTLHVYAASGHRVEKVAASFDDDNARPNENNMLVGFESMIDWMEGGPESPIAANNGRISSELYMAAYESATKQKRIDWPLISQPEFPLNHYSKTV